MTVDELIARCSQAGLACDRNKVNRLVAASVLPPQEGGGGRAKRGSYPMGTDLRLLCALTLEQPAPHGLGYTRAEELRSFLGAVGDERTVDEFLPALAYALEVPGIGAEEARRAGIQFVRKQSREGLEELKGFGQSELTSAFPIEAMMNVGMGRPAYREADTFERPDCEKPPLRDELNHAFSLPEWMKPYSLTSEEWSKASQISRSGLRYLALKKAPEAVLRDAALWARLLTWAMGVGPTPRGETLLTQWGFMTALLLHIPLASLVCGWMKQGLHNFGPPERSLLLLDNREFGKAVEKGNFDAVAIVATNELLPID